MGWEILIALSIMMGLEFAIRGSWAPVLSARLLGPLKMTGKQAGWIYAMYPLMCIFAPLIAGQIVDRWIATEVFLGIAHFASGIALLFAARMTKFRGLLILIAIHCLFFSPTLGLVNSLTFTHLTNPKVEFFWVRLWGSVAWMLVGWCLSVWRRSGKLQFSGSDALLLGALLSFVMAIFCPIFLPHTPPPGGSASSWKPIIDFFSDTNILVFLGISLLVTTQLQFYYMATSKFLEDIGFNHANVPALMTVAQLAEIVTMAVVLPYVLPYIGYRWTLAIGPLLWCAMYLIYVLQRPRWLVIACMALHGLAFAFFLDAAVIYVNHVSPAEIRGTVQSVYVSITLGLGLFIGTHITGFTLDYFRHEEKTNWRRVFSVPCVTLILGSVAFILFFTDK